MKNAKYPRDLLHRAKKGYDEVYIPAVKRTDEKE